MEYMKLADPRAARRHLSLVGGTLALLMLLTVLIQAVSSYIVSLWAPALLQNSFGRYAVQLLPWYLAVVPLTMLLLRANTFGRPPARKLGAARYLSFFPMSYALLFAGSMLGNLVTSVIGVLTGHSVQNATAQLISGTDPLATILFVVLLAPLIEELLFRKFLIDALYPYGEAPAIFISALVFGLFHGNFFQFFYAAAIGGLFGYLYCKTGRIRYSLGLHIFINFLGSVVSVRVLEHVDLRALQQGDIEGLLNDPRGFLLLIGYFGFIMAMATGGVLLFILQGGKVRLLKGAVPFRARFAANAGMITYLLMCVVFFTRSVFL